MNIWSWTNASFSCQIGCYSIVGGRIGFIGSWSTVWWSISPSTPTRFAIETRMFLSCSNRSSSFNHCKWKKIIIWYIGKITLYTDHDGILPCENLRQQCSLVPDIERKHFRTVLSAFLIICIFIKQHAQKLENSLLDDW